LGERQREWKRLGEWKRQRRWFGERLVIGAPTDLTLPLRRRLIP
jgi:hypothetical protein